ncbi:hypothetical protein AVEN_13623-1 [Araneus ventricosus]|uniref:Uncharacterized protein n=1 Tax=Araneus ventricosus TaxID=182803 RepID=A0A4Y2FN42_ARAVE|nr:hypothetical protein AVEN_13623-1 [Araneus ventricosus]
MQIWSVRAVRSFFTMSLEKKERALLMKLFYRNGSNLSTALREYQRLKSLRKGPMSRQALRKMITKFEGLGSWLCCKEEYGNSCQMKLQKKSLLPKSKESPVPNILLQVFVRCL